MTGSSGASTVDPRALAEIARRVAPGAEIVGCKTLAGGQSAKTDELQLRTSGGTWSVVIRRHQALHQLGVARNEFRHLERLHDAGLPVPAPLLFDEGDIFGVPALVLERVAGRPEVDPTDPTDWADTMGRTLASIHAVDLQPFGDLPIGQPKLPDTWQPAIAKHPLGTEAWSLLREQPPEPSPQVLIHGDFQSTNVLWHDGKLTAVLDWTMVSRGDAGVDLGEARIDTMLLFGAEVADVFLDAYQQDRGVAVSDMPKWDLRGAMVLGLVVPLRSWADRYASLGRTDLDHEVLEERLDAWIERALEATAIDST